MVYHILLSKEKRRIMIAVLKKRLPREGLYLDPLCRILARTLFNPLITGTFVFLSNYDQPSQFSAYLGPNFRYSSLGIVKFLTMIGGVFWVNQFLNWVANNNFTPSMPWEPKKELVLITGGSGGIGASVATRLAREGSRVVILDILPLSFSARMFRTRLRTA